MAEEEEEVGGKELEEEEEVEEGEEVEGREERGEELIQELLTLWYKVKRGLMGEAEFREKAGKVVLELLEMGHTLDWISERTSIPRSFLAEVSGEEFVKSFAESELAKATEVKAIGAITRELSQYSVDTVRSWLDLGKWCYETFQRHAQERGKDLRSFLSEAVTFYLDHFDNYRYAIEENKKLRALVRALWTVASPNFLKAYKMDLWYTFSAFVLTLKAQGFKVPREVLSDFFEMLNALEEGRLEVGRSVLGKDNHERSQVV